MVRFERCVINIHQASRKGISACAALLLLFLVGCSERVQAADYALYKVPVWIPLLFGLGMIVLVCVGIYFIRYSWRAWVAVIGGIGGLCVGFPTMLLDHVIVDGQHFEDHGFFGRNEHVRYDDLVSVQITEHERRGRRGRKTIDHKMNLNFKSGTSKTISMGDNLTEAFPEIRAYLEERKIPVVLPPGT